MSYTPFTWVDDSSVITAARLQNIEDEIEAIADDTYTFAGAKTFSSIKIISSESGAVEMLRITTTDTGNTGPLLYFESNRNSIIHEAYIRTDSSTSPGTDMYFFLDNSSGNLIRRFQIQKNGNIIMAEGGGSVGIGTTVPGQILDVNEGSGNMIADGYDNHSLGSYKENLTAKTGIGFIDKLKAFNLYEFTRTPFVSTDELVQLATKELNLKLDDIDAREFLKGLKANSSTKAWIDNKRLELREERKNLPKYKRKHLGLVADDPDTVSTIPDVISRDDDGNIVGYALTDYIGFLHGCIKEMIIRIETLENQ